MRIGSFVLLLAAAPFAAQAQSQAPLPPDIHPVTLSRLPPVTPEDLDDEAWRLFNERESFTPGPGPTHVTVYIPRERSLGVPTGENSPVAGLAEKDATLITFGRTLLRDNKVSSQVWADMVRLFGRQHTIDLLGIMGDYLRVGIMLNAVDQQQPPTRPALLPPLDRER